MAQRPLRIGLSSNIFQPDHARMSYKGRRLLFMEEGMFHWVMRRGALAFLLPTPPAGGGASVLDIVGELDAVIMTGGVDMAPESYGEAPLNPAWAGDKHRDEYEIAMVQAALKLDKPLLGICRGHQVLNVALGGTLYQDVRSQHPGALHHRIFDVYEGNHHKLRIEPGSRLAQLYAAGEAAINSVHHQAIKDVARGLVVEARSPDDGVVEAVRLSDKGGAYLVGVQWHPELQDPADRSLLSADPILDELLSAAKKRQKT